MHRFVETHPPSCPFSVLLFPCCRVLEGGLGVTDVILPLLSRILAGPVEWESIDYGEHMKDRSMPGQTVDST